ncbi:DMT family transporter [Parabacteroides johnsonii]|jgi:hypothetical protein|uniref:DMT family transporter n=1 Tax=Parabacteroides johnsonii TaxID=387661 RepID=UPI001C38473C|nr:DMT family transporter [Parabacteroides johnsonii]MBV4244915.1 DMT family transporter [Parabacteroides johnsonii]
MEKICWKGHAAMFGANAMWGLMSPISKFIMLGGAVTPLVVTDLRIGGAMVLFWITSFFQKPEHVNHKDLASLFVASLLGIVFNQGCFIFGVSLSSPGDASIITTSMPLWAMVLAALILKEPITGKKVLGIAAGASGALLLILGNGQNGQETSATTAGGTMIWGDLLVLLAQFCYALYIVLYKDFVNKYSLVTIMKWMFTYSFICILPFSANSLMRTDWSSLHLPELGGLSFIVVGATFISYMLIVVGQKNLRPTVAGMYNYIQPLVACIVAVCWGMGSFNFIKGIAVVFIFGGVYLVTSSRSRKELESYKANRNRLLRK